MSKLKCCVLAILLVSAAAVAQDAAPPSQAPLGAIKPTETEAEAFGALVEKQLALRAKYNRMLAEVASVRSLGPKLHLEWEPEHKVFLVYGAADVAPARS